MDPYVREREVVREPVVERDPVVVTHQTHERRRGSGGLVAAIIGIALVLLLGWVALNALGVLGEASEEGVEVNVPEVNAPDVDVDVDQ